MLPAGEQEIAVVTCAEVDGVFEPEILGEGELENRVAICTL